MYKTNSHERESRKQLVMEEGSVTKREMEIKTNALETWSIYQIIAMTDNIKEQNKVPPYGKVLEVVQIKSHESRICKNHEKHDLMTLTKQVISGNIEYHKAYWYE